MCAAHPNTSGSLIREAVPYSVRDCWMRTILIASTLFNVGMLSACSTPGSDEAAYTTVRGDSLRVQDATRERDAEELMLPRGEEKDSVQVNPADLPLLTRVSDAHLLTFEEASKRYPVKLRAVVTYYDPEWDMLFVQDESGGIYVNMEGQDRYNLVPGDLVELEGRTDPGDYAPVIKEPKIRRIGKGPLPSIEKNEHDHVLSGQADSRWTQLEGIVRCMHRIGDTHVMFDIVQGGHRVSVYMPVGPTLSNPERLIDAHVRVQGAVGTIFNNRRQLIEARLFTPSMEYVHVNVPAVEDPFSLPIREISQILRFTPGEPIGHRIRIQGEVLAYKPGEEVWVRDSTGGIQVRTPEVLPLQLGDRVDVVGFVESGRFAPFLQDGSLRYLRSGPSPTVIPLTVAEALRGDASGQLIEIEAELLEQTLTAARLQLMLQADGHVFYATLTGPPAQVLARSLRPRSVLRIRGICVIEDYESSGAYAQPSSFMLMMRSDSDVSVTKPAPLWTFENLLRAIAALAGVVLLMAGWVIALRRRVRQQTHIIAQKLEIEEKLKEQAQMASEAKSRFLSAVSHELRTPLTSILGYTDILEDEAKERLRPDEHEYLRTVRESGERLLSLVNDLLDVRAAESGHLQVETASFAAMDVVHEVVRQLYPLAEAKGIHLSAHGKAGLWVRADEARLRQVLLNLTSNAIKFTEEGAVTIEVTEGMLPGSGDTSSSGIAFRVRDTGIGIAPEFMPSLFESFTQEKSTRRSAQMGTGLGLAISRELVQRMGGVISVESEPGLGSVFMFVLPAAAMHEVPVVADMATTTHGGS